MGDAFHDPEPVPPKKHRRPKRLRAKSYELTVKQILRWADAFHEQHGRWPQRTDGSIDGTLQETWAIINGCLAKAHRGCTGPHELALL